MRALRSILFLSSGLFGASPAFAACACGPDFCQDNPRIPNLLKRKKAALAQEYPIENAFSKLKALLRKAAERTVGALWDTIGILLDAFTPTECANYFRAAGYEPE